MDANDPSKSSAAKNSGSGPLARRKIEVLAVDDQEPNLIALEAVLNHDCRLTFARSGAEAVELIQRRSDFDIILMDLQMPDMDGFEAASHIKKLENGREVPIIFITAVYKEDPFIRKGYAAGAVDYFSKPFDPEILKLKVGIYASFRQKSAMLKERELQIHESEELLLAGRKLSSILESLPVGVIIADVDGRIGQINEEVARIFKSQEQIARDSYGEIIGWWDADGKMIKDRRGPLARAIYEGESSHNELVPIRCADGSSTTVLCSASPLRALDGHIVGAVVVMQDMTETRRIQQDLESRITRLVSIGYELQESASSAQ